MKVILYSTGCPKCNILKKKLDEKNIKYDIISDIQTMIAKGMNLLPVLEVDGVEMEYKVAVTWVNNKE